MHTEPPSKDAPYRLSPSEAQVSEVIGRLVQFWGFKRTMGRVWAVLYLSPEPLTADQLRSALALSSGAISMTLAELARWGVVKKVWIQGERRDYFAAEVALWKMISRVFKEREKSEIASAIEAFEDALRALDAEAKAEAQRGASGGHARRALQRERIAQLLSLAKVGQRLLDGLLKAAKIDAQPLMQFLRAPR